MMKNPRLTAEVHFSLDLVD